MDRKFRVTWFDTLEYVKEYECFVVCDENLTDEEISHLAFDSKDKIVIDEHEVDEILEDFLIEEIKHERVRS